METIKYKNEKEYTFESSRLEGESVFELNHLESPIKFCTLNDFNPQVTDGYKNATPIDSNTSSIVTYINSQHDGLYSNNDRTAINTLDRRESAKDIANFVRETIGGFDNNTFANLDISEGVDIYNLTPEEAAKISVNLVRELSNYDHLSVKLSDGFDKFTSSFNNPILSQKVRDTFNKYYTSKGDKSSVLQLLTSLRDKPNTPNGVCRNYAHATKIIFDALKEVQDPEKTKLSDIYCITQSGKMPEGPHMWNVFIANTDDGIAFCPADPTETRSFDDPALCRVYIEKIIEFFSNRNRWKLHETGDILEWEERKAEREQQENLAQIPEEWKTKNEEELPPTEFEIERATNKRCEALKPLKEIYQFYKDSASEYAKFSSSFIDTSNPNDQSLQTIQHFLEKASELSDLLQSHNIIAEDSEMIKSFLERISTLEAPSIESQTGRIEKLSKVGRGVMSLFKSLRR